MFQKGKHEFADNEESEQLAGLGKLIIERQVVCLILDWYL